MHGIYGVWVCYGRPEDNKCGYPRFSFLKGINMIDYEIIKKKLEIVFMERFAHNHMFVHKDVGDHLKFEVPSYTAHHPLPAYQV